MTRASFSRQHDASDLDRIDDALLTLARLLGEAAAKDTRVSFNPGEEIASHAPAKESD